MNIINTASNRSGDNQENVTYSPRQKVKKANLSNHPEMRAKHNTSLTVIIDVPPVTIMDVITVTALE
jgi:hypothetical protein